MKPLLQVALDYLDLDPALEMIKKIESEIDLIEAGTPLIKAEGLKQTFESFQKFTKKPLIADLKAADVADIEFTLASDCGAEFVTVLGSSPKENINDAIESAKKLNLKLVVDLMGVVDYKNKAKELMEMGVKYLGLHCGISEQRQNKTIFSKTKEVSEIILESDTQIVVAGGIKENNIHLLKNIKNIAIIIVGGGITNQKNPLEATKILQEKIRNL